MRQVARPDSIKNLIFPTLLVGSPSAPFSLDVGILLLQHVKLSVDGKGRRDQCLCAGGERDVDGVGNPAPDITHILPLGTVVQHSECLPYVLSSEMVLWL